jgi:hypothetical protein
LLQGRQKHKNLRSALPAPATIEDKLLVRSQCFEDISRQVNRGWLQAPAIYTILFVRHRPAEELESSSASRGRSDWSIGEFLRYWGAAQETEILRARKTLQNSITARFTEKLVPGTSCFVLEVPRSP